ncbi:MAG TPA: hypothetical protein VEH06_09605 [Candidatus Bathyarchaeia archaeon]|nr:hypothetical protein [Candidatus Bathyarchaeia archaeon]
MLSKSAVLSVVAIAAMILLVTIPIARAVTLAKTLRKSATQEP